jgi:ATP-binding cassette subfamily B protein
MQQTLRWLRMLQPQRRRIALVLACQCGQTLAALLLPHLSADLLDRGVALHDTRLVAHLGGWMLLAALAQLALSLVALAIGTRIAMDAGRELRAALFARVHALSLAEVQHLGVPSLITRCTNDVLQLQTLLVMLLTVIMLAPLMGLGGVAMALRQDVQLSGLLLVAVPLLAVVVATLMGRAVPLFGRMQGQLDRVNAILREQIVGLRVIRAFVRDEAEQARFGRANDDLTGTALRAGRLMALNMPAVMAVLHLAGVAVVWLAAGRIHAGTLAVGTVVAFLAYNAQILISVMMAAMLFLMAPRAVVSARRVAEVLDTAPSVRAPDRPLALPSDPRTLARLAFDDVSFGYPGAQAPVLRDIGLRVGPGELLGVIGPTGSGKSTLLGLAMRLYDPSGGRVTLAGVDLRHLDPEALWAAVSIVPQASFLFSGTVAGNLRYGREDATDDELWHALDVAQARDFVAALPGRLDAPVAQGGGNFSGGQRQRLTIARALVRRPAVLLLDDSFSALDASTDARLRAALRAERRDGATIVVSQRVASLRQADRIVVLDQGRIVGSGRHEELLASCPEYAEIVGSQTAQDAEDAR